MTNNIVQMPGQLNLEMIDDNDFVFSINWNMDLTDYEFEANIIPKNYDTEIPMIVNIVDAVNGKMNIIISASSIMDIPPATHKWYLNWTTPAPESYIRTVLNGSFVTHPR